MADLTCTAVEQLAAEYALGVLTPPAADDVRAHLGVCPSCNEEVEALRRLGDAMLDLVPDAEPPLGFDQKVLARLHPRAQRRRRHLATAAVAVAAAASAVLALAGDALVGTHHAGEPSDVTAALVDRGRSVGSVYVGGHPPWVTMSIRDLTATGPVTCELQAEDGSVATIGTFRIEGGNGSWTGPEPAGLGEITAARLLAPSGEVLATADLRPTRG